MLRCDTPGPRDYCPTLKGARADNHLPNTHTQVFWKQHWCWTPFPTLKGRLRQAPHFETKTFFKILLTGLVGFAIADYSSDSYSSLEHCSTIYYNDSQSRFSIALAPRPSADGHSKDRSIQESSTAHDSRFRGSRFISMIYHQEVSWWSLSLYIYIYMYIMILISWWHVIMII